MNLSLNNNEPDSTSEENSPQKPLGSKLHSIECVQFVRAAMDLTSRDRELSAKGHVCAMGVCRVLLEMSVDEFGADGKQVLIDWGIKCSEDVGLIVFRLVEAGYVGAVIDDSIDQFDGLFDLNLPVETWQIKW
ncbi:MAG: hypothetical protein U0930_16815 [Pirellulales bacterium]